jgi:hypothetical protein
MRVINYLLSLSIVFSSCKEPFAPYKDPNTKSVLVVDGFIDTGGGKISIRLTRTANLGGPVTYWYEPDATLKIEGEDGSSISTITDFSGVGIFTTRLTDSTQKYKLSITTHAGKIYSTDFLENKKSPEIKSIAYKTENCQLRIVINTEDKTNSARYYQWTFYGGFEGGDPSISRAGCDDGQFSKEILVASSAKLVDDNIYEFPIAFAKKNCFEIRNAFSIDVIQSAITSDGYNYLLNMKKNTEKIGGIFDPQPSEILGNIKCISNPSEPVIGFISCGTVSKKSFKVLKKDIFNWVHNGDNCIDKY